MGGIITYKNSPLFDKMNFIVAERMTNVIDVVNKSRTRLLPECERHFFDAQQPKAQIGHEQLSLATMDNLFIMYLLLSLASVATFCAEVVLTQIGRKFQIRTKEIVASRLFMSGKLNSIVGCACNSR